MAIELITQAVNQIGLASNILLLASSGSDLDSVASGLALKEFLSKSGKQVRFITPAPLSPKLEFLPDASTVGSAEGLSKNLLIEVSLGKTKLSELTYQKQENFLKIFITPKFGAFDSDDVSVKTAIYPFDLIITLGVASLEELGAMYSDHAEMFFQTPVVNIDYKPSNENYGQVNLVSLVSSSVSEVSFDFLESMDTNSIDEKVATLLLAGLVYQTNSFQTQKTSPQVFLKASKLVTLGGKQQEIISQLYRSKSMGLLHLWGRVLARLKQDLANSLVYSAVNSQDLERSGAQSSDIDEIIYEMSQQLSFAKHFVFIVEKSSEETMIYALAGPPLNLQTLFSAYELLALPQKAVRFTVSKPITTVENEIIHSLQEELGKHQS